jgi:hypothetical protein
MIYNKFHFQLGKIKLIDCSFSQDSWEYGDDSFTKENEAFMFELSLRDKVLTFDVVFDLEASCNWYYEKGDYNQPDFYQQENLKTDVKIKGVYGDSDIDLDLNDSEISKLLTNLIIFNL